MHIEYGSVEVIRGRHKGKVGYYDDTLGLRTAIVYLDDELPTIGRYILIRSFEFSKKNK